MDGWSAIPASDNDPSSSEGEYMVEQGPEEEAADREQQQQRGNVDGMDDMGNGAVGFGMSGTGEGKVVLGRLGQRDDKELRYLHLLWEPGRGEFGAGDVACKLGKITGSRARRHHRAVRNLGPIGKDVYGKQRYGKRNSVCGVVVMCLKMSLHKLNAVQDYKCWYRSDTK